MKAAKNHRKWVTLFVGIVGLFGATTSFGEEPEFKTFIIGGTEVVSADPIARSTVMISGETLINGSVRHYICSGSVIGRDLILTAAHCLAEDPSRPVAPANLKIVFATHATDSSAVFMPVLNYEVHPGWANQIQAPDAHDLAVIRIRGKIPAGYSPAVLPNRALSIERGDSVTLAGYGVTDGTHPSFSTTGVLRRVSVPVIGSNGSTEILVDESHQKGSCGGDSGGPAFIEVSGVQVLWGVTSRGDTLCSRAGVYTRVDAYFDFLNTAVNHLHARQ